MFATRTTTWTAQMGGMKATVLWVLKVNNSIWGQFWIGNFGFNVFEASNGSQKSTSLQASKLFQFETTTHLILTGWPTLWGSRLSQPAAAWQPLCEELGREWRNGEEMERESGNGERLEMEREIFLPSPFPLLLSISSVSSFSSFSSHILSFPLNLRHLSWVLKILKYSF